MLKLVHISDTHGAKFHTKVKVPECDVLIHSGDIGGRTNLLELGEFLNWFQDQPAEKKIFIPGNHDIILDWDLLQKQAQNHVIGAQVAKDLYEEAMIMINKAKVIFLNDKDHFHKGIKFYGSPWSPTFGHNWAFNADRGEEIARRWKKIPNDTNVLITHGPPYKILDIIPDTFKKNYDEDVHRGCKDLSAVIQTRLNNLKLHCFGHIHDGPTGIIRLPGYGGKYVTYSNGAVISNYYELVMPNPPIIEI